jgi:cytochrome c1
VVIGMPTMPANPHLRDEEIKNLIAFIRSIEK